VLINVLDYLEISALKYPDKLAFVDQEHKISYAELIYQAKAIGSNLSTMMNGQTKKPVAVFIDRSIASLVLFLGVVYSGNFYVPIDGQMPKNRIELIFNTLQPQAVILLQKDSAVLENIDFTGSVLFFDDAVASAVDEERLCQIKRKAIDTDPLYAMFTSGSTGIPKGALICHRSVIDLIEHFTEVFGFSEESVFGNQAPFDFDVSVKDIYSTLKNGATMYIIPKVMFSFPGKLIEYLNSTRVNTTIWATSALRIVANLKALEKDIPLYLTKIMFSGEVMPNKVLNYWRKILPNVMYVNLYGPTEITCNCTYFIVDRPFADLDVLPIGIPFPNTDILVLNDKNLVVQEDEIGEICVRGTSLALGYYNNPGETSRAFCQNPLNSHVPELIYRTGDLGKYNDLGELLFLSRRDSQIKHMGHRIELGEIEVAANALDFLDVACCLYDSTHEKIVMFYQSPSKCDREILLGLSDSLPKYMMPNTLIHSEKLPMNKNAKIDRIKLQEWL
jgi:D-alanine--poly(phosphoribitol) ligase subunit 1